MELLPSAWSLITATIVFVVGVVVSIKIGPRFGVRQRRSLGLYLWHSLFCIAYLLFVRGSGGDALMYYDVSLLDSVDVTFGTAAVVFLTRVFSYFVGLSILGVFLVYNIIGFVGLVALDGALKYAVEGKRPLARRFAALLVLLPSISFWSSGIGKDAISFAAVGLALWAVIRIKRRFWLMVIAVLMMLAVRPHIAVLMCGTLAVSVMLDSHASLPRRLSMGVAALVASALLVPLAMGTSGLEQAGGIDAFEDYVERRQAYNLEGSGGVDISSMSLPMKLFTYMFRPLPFEAHNLPSLAASIDNLVLVGLFLLGAFNFRRGHRNLAGVNWVFLVTYALATWVLLSLTTANLGISMRQKWMFAPILIFLFISVIGRQSHGGVRRLRRPEAELGAPRAPRASRA